MKRAHNTPEYIVWLEIDGVRLCRKDWCARYGSDEATAAHRLKRGWDALSAVSAPAFYNFRALGPYHPTKETHDPVPLPAPATLPTPPIP